MALKHMLSDFLVLLLAHHMTERLLAMVPHWRRAIIARVTRWRPESFAVWPRQREW